MAGEGLPVEVACRVLCVSCAGFYAWRFRPPSARAVRHAWLTDVIREVHATSYGNYGAKRVHAELILGRGILVGHNAVAMLMQRAAIVGRSGARKRYGIPGAACAEDLVDRVFIRERPNQLWVTDITEHPTRARSSSGGGSTWTGWRRTGGTGMTRIWSPKRSDWRRSTPEHVEGLPTGAGVRL
jgi:hypothetical protein